MEENYQYVEDLPLATVVPQTKLPESNLGKIFTEFKTTLPQYTRVNPNAINQEETLEQAMDRINNTPTGVNYIPNIAAPVTVGVDTSKYKDVDISLAQIQSGKLEQYAAQSQSYWDKLWNDTKVTGANLGIGFASAFTSIYDMINDGSFIPSENSVTSNLGKISSEFAEKNTNFQTQYDIDNPIKSLLLPSFLTGSSKGWGEIAKSASIGIGTGAGILVQELGIGAVTGGIGSIPILANNIRNLIRNSKVITQAAETASGLRAGTTSIAKGVQSVLALENTIAAANTTKNIINLGKNTVRSALSAYGESAFEAQETRDSFTLEKIKEFRDANGRLPNEKELKRIKDVAEQAHDARFLLNFGLLTFSNMPFLNGVFKQFDDVLSVSEQAAAKGLKYTGRAGDGFEKSFQLTSNWWNKNAVTKGMKTAIETGQPLAKNILTGKSITWSEGLEEGYQFWVDKATNNYYNTIYNKGTNDIIDGTLTDTIYGLANSFYQTKEQLLSTEGLQNIIGGILGGTGQSIVSKGIDIAKNGIEDQFKEGSKFRTETNQQVKEGTKELLELQKAINLESITGDLSSKVEAVRGAYTGVGLMQESNSVITFDKLKDITKFHTIAPMVMRGQTDILKDDLTKSLLETDDEQFKLMTGVSEVNSGIKQKYISDILNDIDKVDKSVRRNLSTFRNKYQKGSDEYKLYEDAKKVFAFHGYISENMIERKKDLESKNSILFNAPNISSALELATQGTNKEELLNQIKQRKTQFESDIQIATPVVKEGEKTQIDSQTQQLIKQTQEKLDILTALENKVNTFKGENVQEVFELLTDVLIGFDQLDLVANDASLNLQNQLDKILNTFTDHQILSTNLAEHLETYNNLVQNYSDSKKLKETLDKYKEQGMIVQSSFKQLKEFNKFKDVRSYFIEKATEVGLPPESEFFIEITKGIKQLQAKDAEFEEYKELIDKNIEQFQKENQPEELPEEETQEIPEEQTDVKTQTADDLYNEDIIKILKDVHVKINNNQVKNENLPNYVEQLNDFKKIILAQSDETNDAELQTRVLKNIDFLTNKINRILNTVTEEEFDAEVDKEDLTSKIQDIEKRREIDLKENVEPKEVLKVETYETESITTGEKQMVQIRTTKGGKKEIFVQGEGIQEGRLIWVSLGDTYSEKVSNEILLKFTENPQLIKTQNEQEFVKEQKELYKGSTRREKINAKYDEELKKLGVTSKPKPEVKKSEIKIEPSKEEYTKQGSIRSKVLESIVFTNENNEIEYIEKNENVLKNHTNLISDLIQKKLVNSEFNLDLDTLRFKKLDKILPNKDSKGVIVNLEFDKALARKVAKTGIEITDDKGNYLMLVQSPENLFIDVPFIMTYKDELFKDLSNKNQIIETLSKYKSVVPLLEAIDTFLDAKLYKILNETVVEVWHENKQKNIKHPLLMLRENYTDFVSILKTQKEKYDEFYNTEDSKLLKKFKSLYEINPYANGLNSKEGKYVEANFTPDLPFNFIGNWKNPIFTLLSDNKISAENVTGISNEEYQDTIAKLKSKLDELKEKNPNFYNILKDQGTFFTAFTTELGEIFIKPIILRKSNNSADGKALELENKVFNEKGEYIKGQAKLLGEDYVFFAFDQKVNGQSVRLKFVENEKGQLNAAFVVFSERDDEKVYDDYYLNNLSKEDFKNLLNGKLTKKPQIRDDKKGISDSDYLDVYNLTIVERIKNRDVSKLLDGSYKVKDVNNPTSIFQNVGFRLKFKEKQEEIDSVIPKSFVVETNTFQSKVKNNFLQEKEISNSNYEIELKNLLEEKQKKENELNRLNFLIYKELKEEGKETASYGDIAYYIARDGSDNPPVIKQGKVISNYNTGFIYSDEKGEKIRAYYKNTYGNNSYFYFSKKNFNTVSYEEINENYKKLKKELKEKYKEQKSEPALVEQMYNATEEDKQTIKSEETINKSIEDKIKDLENLGKENLKSVSDKGLGKEIKTWDKLKDIYKNEEDISLIFSKFEQLKTETKKSIVLKLKKELKDYFDESINTPITQRAIIDNKEIEEIAKQYVINCK